MRNKHKTNSGSAGNGRATTNGERPGNRGQRFARRRRARAGIEGRAIVPCALVGLLVLVLAAGVPAQTQDTQTQQRAGDGEAQQRAVPVRSTTLEKQTVYERSRYGARLRPSDYVSVGAPLGGVVDRIAVRPGDRVSAGMSVVTLRKAEPGESFRPAQVEAPTSGIVTEVPVRRGQQVTTGQELVRIAEDGRLRARVQVSDKDIGFLSRGDRCLVTFPESGTEVEGTVLRLHPEPDYQRGLFAVDVQMPPDLAGRVGDARIGRFVRVAFLTRPYTGLVIPEAALTEQGARSAVFLVADGAAVRRAVELGAEYPEGVAVREGLSAGDEVILSPPPGLQEGSPVAVGGEAEDGQ
jgi:multidrug efflux pump subunit AcrA (membrane-fusion protein)